MAEKNRKPTPLEWGMLLFTALFVVGSCLWYVLLSKPEAEDLTLVALESPGGFWADETGVEAPGMLEGEVLDLNTASEGDLSRLPGIGAQRAADIAAWREANGGFQSEEDILEVPGIGPGIYGRISPYICVIPQGEEGGDDGADFSG